MAETTAAILTYLGTSAGAAASVGSAVGTLGSAVGTVGSIFGAVAPFAGVAGSLASAGLQVAGGQQEGAALQLQAQQTRIQAQSERLRGQAQSNQVRAGLLRTLSAQNARYASAGLDVGSGTPEALAQETRRQAELDLGLLDTNAELAALGFESQATALTARAKQTRSTGTWRAGFSLFDAVDRYSARQPGRARAPAPAPGAIAE